MSIQTQAVQTRDPEKAIEFIPYGAADKIRLSVKIIQNMVAVPTKSGKTCSERDALRFLMLCQAQRLNPFAGDAFLVGYDSQDGPSFSLITAHQAFLKRAETCADFEGMESGIILLGDDENPTISEREGDFHLENEIVVGGWARVHRKGRRDTYRRIRMGRFNKGFAQWKADAAGMIVKCAEADALRSTFPTLLGGLYMQGEQDGAAGRIVAEMSISRPIFEAPAKLIESKMSSSDHFHASQESQARIDDVEGTDLGPQKSPSTDTAAAQSEPERNVQRAAQEPPPPEDPSAAVKRQAKALKSLLTMKGHSEVELIQFLVAQKGLDDSLGTLNEISKVAGKFLGEIHDGWAKIEPELRAWKEEQTK
jgi:phage recombination protein Bet